jgi:hypothetical protein
VSVLGSKEVDDDGSMICDARVTAFEMDTSERCTSIQARCTDIPIVPAVVMMPRPYLGSQRATQLQAVRDNDKGRD